MADLDKKRARDKRWSQTPHGKASRRERAKRYYRKHRDQILARKRQERQENPELFKERDRRHNGCRRDSRHRSERRSRIKRLYGLTEVQFNALLQQQKGLCWLCEQPMDRPCADHDHETNAVRGLAHSNCNALIGLAGEDPAKLRQIAANLERRQYAAQ